MEKTRNTGFNLGGMKDIRYYKLIHSGIVGETEHNTVAYQLQYLESDSEDWDTIETLDDSAWVDMDNVTGNTQTVTQKVFDEPVHARYIRVYVTDPAPSNKALRLHELELYEEAPAEFYEKQDILNAEIQTKQEIADTPVEMKTWIAEGENVLVTELTSKGTEDAALQAEVWANAGSSVRPVTEENDETSVTVTRSTQNTAPDSEEAHVSKAALSTKVIGADDVSASSDNESGSGTLEFTLDAGATVYIVTAAGGGGRTYHNDGTTLWEAEKEPKEEAADILGRVPDETALADLNARRQEWWKDFWSASYVDFGTEDENLNKVQKYYYGAQYMLGSSAREDEVAPGLYGVWHT